MTRFYYFPKPYPDELIGSVFLRACRHLGLSRKTLSILLTAGIGRNYWSIALPSGLRRMAEVVEMEAYDLLWQHSIFPYATAFMSQEETCRIAENLVRENSLGNAALTQNGTQGPLGQRYCVKCLKYDQDHYGEAYWHRIHNLPFVYRCPVHLIPLRTTFYSRANLGVRSLPRKGDGLSILPLLSRDLEHAIAAQSIDLLTRTARLTPDQWHCLYRNQAISKGFPQHGTGLASRAIANTFPAFYGRKFLQSAGLDIAALRPSWPALMLQEQQSVPFSTQKHVLLGVFLERANPGSIATEYKQPGRQTRDYAELDNDFVARLVPELILIQQGDTRVETTSLLDRMDFWHIYRHHRNQLPQTVELLTEFKKTNFSARQTGKRVRKKN